MAAGQFRQVLPADLQYAHQMGASGVSFNALDLDDVANRRSLKLRQRAHGSRRGYWDIDDLCRLRETVEEHGLRIESMENVPARMMHHIKIGDSEREAQLDDYCRTIENLGRAEIPILGYEFMLLPVIRSSFDAPTRGGARTSCLDPDALDGDDLFDVPPACSEEVWERYEHFVRRVVPVAESAGVKLAMHPDDPPLSELGGTGRILNSVVAIERALGIVDSSCHGMNFCVGTLAESDVDQMYRALASLTRAGKVLCVHFRNVRHDGASFTEVFVDDGDVDVVRTMQILVHNGFRGFILDDHVPQMVGDSGWRHRGRAFSTGYIKGLMDAIASTQVGSDGDHGSAETQESLST